MYNNTAGINYAQLVPQTYTRPQAQQPITHNNTAHISPRANVTSHPYATGGNSRSSAVANPLAYGGHGGAGGTANSSSNPIQRMLANLTNRNSYNPNNSFTPTYSPNTTVSPNISPTTTSSATANPVQRFYGQVNPTINPNISPVISPTISPSNRFYAQANPVNTFTPTFNPSYRASNANSNQFTPTFNPTLTYNPTNTFSPVNTNNNYLAQNQGQSLANKICLNINNNSNSVATVGGQPVTGMPAISSYA